MVLKEVAGRLLENDEGQSEDESDMQAWSQNTGVLRREKISHKTSFTTALINECFVFFLTYSHSGAIFADTSIEDDVEVVVAGVEGTSDDANDGENVQLDSNDGQLRANRNV